MIEAELPLVNDRNALFFSPWHQTARPLAGVMHGLYVFTVIDTYFKTLHSGHLLTPDEREFVSKRREQITQEVAQVANLVNVEGLTNEGEDLVGQLLQRFGLDSLHPM